MQKSAFSRRYLPYYFHAKTYYRIHSPLAYEFASAILEDKRNFYAFASLNALQKSLRRDERSIALLPNEESQPPTIVTMQQIQYQHYVSRYYHEILFRTIHFYKPEFILELGTSLGITTMYAAAAALNRNIYTIEQEPAIANAAKQHFNLLRFKNIQPIIGDYQEMIDNELLAEKKIDCLILSLENISHKNILKPYLERLNEPSLIIILGISKASKRELWQFIQQHQKVTLTIDVYNLGIAFCNTNILEKQQIMLIASSKKWR